MNRIFLTVAVLAAAFTAGAEEYGIFWKNTEDGGSFSDPKMWMTANGGSEETPHFDKGPERWMRMFTKSGGNHTALLGDYNMLGAWWVYLWGGEASMTLDGADSVFTQTSPGDEECVNLTARYNFAVNDNDYNFSPISLTAANPTADSTFAFSNSLQRFSRSTSEGWFKWELTRGRFSFAEPDGMNSTGKLKIADTGKGLNLFSALFSNVDTILPKFEVLCFFTNTVVKVDGGSMVVNGEFKFDASGSAVGTRDYVGTNDFIVCAGAGFTQAGGTTTIGLEGNAPSRRDVITVTDPSTTYTVGAACGKWNMEANSGLVVSNGATWAYLANTEINVGANIGAKSTTDARPTVLATGKGTVFDCSASASFGAYYNSDVKFTDGAEVRLPEANVIGGNTKMANTEATMTISGEDTLVTVKGTNNGGQVLRIGEGVGAGKLHILGGTLRGAADNHSFMLRLGIAENIVGELNVSGGTVDVGTKGNGQCYVGMHGSGKINMSGGTLTGKDLFVGYGSQMKSAQTSIVNQTGGLIDMDGQGFVLCNYGNTANRLAIANLDGGTTRVSRVIGDKTVANGFLGRAEIRVNGGTLIPKASKFTEADSFMSGIDSFTVGARGLTIDTGAYDTLVRQPMEDKAGESGVLFKKGSATLLLSGGGYSVANTQIEEGTLLVTNETATLSTALRIAQGGRLSLQGPAASLALDALSVDGGTIVLDPDDVIHVSGKVSVSKLNLEFSSLPELDGGDAGFLVCDGRLDDDSLRAVRRAISRNVVSGSDGAYLEFTSSYDENTGKTTIYAVHATESAALSDDKATFWKGAGESWLSADNWSAGVPSASMLAIFGDASGGSVRVEGAAEAAAVSFRAGEYTVSGGGTLAVAGKRGEALVEVAEGAVAVSVPVSLGTVAKIPVAAGARLSFNAPIRDGGIRKTGSGLLTLAGGNDFLAPLEALGGVTELADGDAVRGATKVSIGGATLSVTAGQNISAPITVSSAYEAPAILKSDAETSAAEMRVDGALIKRGAGRFTLDIRESDSSSVLTTLNQSPSAISPTYFPDDGSAPDLAGCWAGFTVAEGEFAVLGDRSDTLSAKGCVSIGMNATNMSETAQARLTVDGATFDNMTGVASPLLVGYGTSLQFTRQYTPTLALVNGAFLKAYQLVLGRRTYGATAGHATLLVTNSTVYTSEYLQFSNVDAWESNCAVTRAGGAELMTAKYFYLQGRFDVDVTDTYIGGGDSSGERTAEPVRVRVDTYNAAQPGGTFALRGGSVLSAYFENMSYPTNPIEFVWEDAEWRWSAALGDYTFAASSVNTDLFKFTMEGRGIVLKPAAGATFTTEVPFTGAGGMCNKGDGTVKFASGTYKFTGPCEVSAGATVDLSDAGVVSGAAFKGAGTVSRGSFGGITRIDLSGVADDWTIMQAPTFENCIFNGRVLVDFGRSADNPLNEDLIGRGSIAVAKFSGAAPDVSGWKVKAGSTGLKFIGGTFSVDEESGEVRMTPCSVGTVIVVR